METLNNQGLYENEKKLIVSILEIVGLSEKSLENEHLYEMELGVHGYGFDTLLGILMKKYHYSDKIYNIFRCEGRKSDIDRLLEVEKYLLELESNRQAISNRVAEIVN